MSIERVKVLIVGSGPAGFTANVYNPTVANATSTLNAGDYSVIITMNKKNQNLKAVMMNYLEYSCLKISLLIEQLLVALC